MDIKGRTIKIIVDHLGVDEKAVVPAARFQEDLGADSLDIVELVMAVEEEFGLEIQDDDIENLKTVDDLFSYLAAHATK